VAFLTLDQEAALVAALSQTARVDVDVLGQTVQGRPLRLLRIGIPPPAADDQAALFLVGALHGDEQAGRDALLDLAEHLATVQTLDTRLRLPDAAGAYASTPDTAALDITGDIDLRVDATLDAWVTGAPHGSINYLIAKYTTTGNQRSYTLRLSTDGTLQLVWSANGTNLITRSATEALVPGPGGRLAVRATLDVDNGASDNTTRFYTAPSMAGPWVQLGDAVPGSGATTSIFSGTGVLEIGSHTAGSAGTMPGYIHAVEVRSGIDGTLVADPDFSTVDESDTSFADGAGRTWTVHGTAAVVDLGDPALVSFLAAHGVMIVVTANPDGVAANTRTNANGVDLNRDWLALEQPEVRAITQAIGRAAPLVLVDHHEADPQLSSNVTFAPPSNPQCDSGVVDEADALIVIMKARIVADGWTQGDFGDVTGEPNRLVSNSGMRHAAAVLVETSVSQDEADRVAQHRACADEALAWLVANVGDAEAEAADAAARVAAAGAAGDAFDLNNGTVLDPAPLGYTLPGVLPAFHLDAFGIAVISPNAVSMAQSAQPLIPYLFDPASDHVVLAGIRLTSLPVPAVVASVAEFAAVVSGSHEPLIEALLVTGFQSGFNPTGLPLPIIDGDVQFDAAADVLAECQLLVPGQDEDNDRSTYPRRPTDPLAPYGVELFLRRGVDLGDQIIWSPLGYFGLRTVEQDDAPLGPIRLSGQDRMAGLIEARPLAPRELRASRTVQSVFTELVGEVYPTVAIVFDDDSGAETIGRTLVVEESRYEPLRELANSLGKILYWDGEGALRVESAPDSTVPLWELRAGRGGVLITAARRVTRDGISNALIVTGEAGSTGRDPVLAAVADLGPTSPTRWASIADGGFGFVPRFYSSPFIDRVGLAATAAREMLRRNLGAPHSVDFGSAVNPALRPWHPLRATYRDGNREIHVVQRLTIPLTVTGVMAGATRETTQVVIGAIPGGVA
jgi:hypothetical protein